MLRFIWMCKISTVSEKVILGVCEITKSKGRSYAYTQNMQKMRCFLDKFTQLARILHDRRSRRSWQILTLHSRRKWDVKLQHNNISESPAPHNFVINLNRGSSFAFVFSETWFLLETCYRQMGLAHIDTDGIGLRLFGHSLKVQTWQFTTNRRPFCVAKKCIIRP